MKVLITQHYFNCSDSVFPAAVAERLEELRDGREEVVTREGFKQEVFECDLLVEAVAYAAGLDVEDITSAPHTESQEWIENEFGIFISSETDASSYIIIDHSPTANNTKH